MHISTFVFFDLETTGLPHQEKNQTKIVELTFIATSTEDIKTTPCGALPPINKLSLLFNPEKKVDPRAACLTGLSQDMLTQQPIFKSKIKTITSFLEELPKPVCLVAHNGNRFDFKILKAEFVEANSMLPDDLLCADSLCGFRKIFKENTQVLQNDNSLKRQENKNLHIRESTIMQGNDDLLTDDEDEWPQLNASYEEWLEIDQLSLSMGQMSYEEKIENNCKSKSLNNPLASVLINEKVSFNLSNLYSRLLKKEPLKAHRAESDCLMLLECVVATKNNFLPWVNVASKLISEIKPLNRINNK